MISGIHLATALSVMLHMEQEGDEMSEWKSIESAPKDRPIHVYDPRYSFTRTLPRLVKWNGRGWYRQDRDGFMNMYVPATHWREPPSPDDIKETWNG